MAVTMTWVGSLLCGGLLLIVGWVSWRMRDDKKWHDHEPKW